jgi:hypothetical protein
VHPRTGSIFSAPRRETRSPLQDWDATETVTPAQPSPDPRQTSPELDAQEPHRSATSPSEPTPLLPAIVEPAPRVTQQPSAMDEASEIVASAVAHPTEQPDDAARSRILAVTDVRVTTPVAQRTDEAMPTPVTRGVLDTDAPGAVRRPSSRDPRLTRAERQPDEIQIHIGRIEVTAVPPPAPRAPRPPDRSLSLDAYLRRRDGRAK